MAKKTLTRTLAPAPSGTFTLSGTKFVDTDNSINRTGKMARYWDRKGFREFWKELSNRPGSLPQYFFKTEPDQALVKYFNLRSLEYGNYVNNEARFNYIFATITALYDLNQVLGFGNNIGFGMLSIAYGSRGQGSATASFNPGSFVINLTRYARKDRLLSPPRKGTPGDLALFEGTGGIGSLAHEYGHFLDVLGGNFYDKSNTYFTLTKGKETNYNFDKTELHPGSMRGLTNMILDKLVNDKNGDYTTWYKKLKEKYSTKVYWFQHNEIFARSFETYIHYKLSKARIRNLLLTETKYEPGTYPGPGELKLIIPLFDKLMKEFARKAKDKQLTLQL